MAARSTLDEQSDSEEVIFSSDGEISDDDDDYSTASSDDVSDTNREELDFCEIDDNNMKTFNLHVDEQPDAFNGFDSPIQFYRYFMDDALLDIIVNETNANADKVILSSRLVRKSRLNEWTPTDREEMKKFLAIVLFMGLVKYPKISDYWSQKLIFSNNFVKSLISRNRFQLLLRMIHFATDEDNPNDRLRKVRNIISYLNTKFKCARVADENIVIDESMVPWRGRLVFRQYNPGKRHRYGIKIYKLCGNDGYTYSFMVYAGKNSAISGEQSTCMSHASRVVLELSEYYLNSGRTITTDNFYTSFELAKLLLDKRTHLVGTIRKNRKGLPKALVTKKLARGEVIGKQERRTGITIMKWKDKRDVLMLSTKHGLQTRNVTNRRGKEIQKPAVILAYNSAKQGIDLSDQMASYFSPLRRTVRWYHKVAFEIMLNTAVVNSFLLYKLKCGANMQIPEFREKVILSLSGINQSNVNKCPSTPCHQLKETTEMDARRRKRRRRCSGCYNRILQEKGREAAASQAKRVITYCLDCHNQPALCVQCFLSKHT